MDLSVYLQKFLKKTCINVDGLEWLRPKWKGLGSLYFKFASNLATIFYDEIITDSIEMKKIYIKIILKKINSNCIWFNNDLWEKN